MLKEFKEFIMRGNVMDMAVGIIIGAAFSAIVNSFVKDIIMPPIGLIFKKDFANLFVVLKGRGLRPSTTIRDPGRCAGGRCSHPQLRQFHQLRYHIPDRGLRDIHADPMGKQTAPGH